MKDAAKRRLAARRSESPRFFRRGASSPKPAAGPVRTESYDSIVFKKRLQRATTADSVLSKKKQAATTKASSSSYIANSYVAMTRNLK